MATTINVRENLIRMCDESRSRMRNNYPLLKCDPQPSKEYGDHYYDGMSNEDILEMIVARQKSMAEYDRLVDLLIDD